MALFSQNIANVSTPDYAVETLTQQSLTANGEGLGVLSGAARRSVDTTVQSALFSQEAIVTGLQVSQSALAGIDAVQGTPGQGTDLASLLGTLRAAFSALLGSPENPTQQTQVVTAADALARHVNDLSDAYTHQRQAAQNDLVDAVAELNETLGRIGDLSGRIVALKAGAHTTADLENQRDAAVHDLARLVGIRTLELANGDLVVMTVGGLALPTRSGHSLSIDAANLQPEAYYPNGGAPAVMLGGQDVTSQLRDGRIGADIVLRDGTIPTFQAELDEFAETLAARFDAQGLTLFTDPSGAVPATGGTPAQANYVGFAGTIGVNPSVAADAALVRDGTSAIAGSATGASAFTPNPSGGPAGFTLMIQRVLDHALGAEVQDGVAHAAPSVSGLGPDGTLSAPYAAPPTLAELASTLVASQARTSASVTSRTEDAQLLRDGLADRVKANSGVNMDTEMTRLLTLQSAYAANARLITVIQAVFEELMNVVR